MEVSNAGLIALRGSTRGVEHLRVTRRYDHGTCGKAVGCYVYMLRCADGSFYVGSATGDDLSRRIAEHQTGAYQGYTYKRRPVSLVWSEHFDRISDAVAAERQIKGWSRAKKMALIGGDWERVQALAKRRAGKPAANKADSSKPSS